jgi:hypothetical protein
MNWYLVKLVYRVVCGSGSHTPQFNCQVRLMEAEDVLHAFYKARLTGERETITLCDKTTPVYWKFIDVLEIISVNHYSDGAEILSEINEEQDADMYIRMVHKRSAALLEEGILQLNNLNVTNIDA